MPLTPQTPRRLVDRLCIRHVILFPLHERFDVDRQEQPHLVAEPADLAAPLMSARASLHRDHAARLRGEKVQLSLPAQFPAERDRAVRLRAVKLKAAFRQINPDDG